MESRHANDGVQRERIVDSRPSDRLAPCSAGHQYRGRECICSDGFTSNVSYAREVGLLMKGSNRAVSVSKLADSVSAKPGRTPNAAWRCLTTYRQDMCGTRMRPTACRHNGQHGNYPRRPTTNGCQDRTRTGCSLRGPNTPSIEHVVDTSDTATAHSRKLSSSRQSLSKSRRLTYILWLTRSQDLDPPEAARHICILALARAIGTS
jgi:hypothetical protein